MNLQFVAQRRDLRLKKFLRIVGNIIVVLFLVLALSVMTLVLTSQKSDGIPNILGYSPLAVKSDSMEPLIKKGDMILITGMGHEQYRIINGERLPWNDGEVVREILGK